MHPVQALRLCTCLTAHSGSRGIALLFHDHGTRRGEGSASRPGRALAPRKFRYPLYGRLGGTQGRPGQVRKISPTPAFDPRTVQHVASRYNGYATRPTVVNRVSSNVHIGTLKTQSYRFYARLLLTSAVWIIKSPLFKYAHSYPQNIAFFFITATMKPSTRMFYHPLHTLDHR